MEDTSKTPESAESQFTEPFEPDLGRIAIVLTQLQAEVMAQGNQLGRLMQQTAMLDKAAHQRLTTLEKTAGLQTVSGKQPTNNTGVQK